jgi:photosystem I subunit 11
VRGSPNSQSLFAYGLAFGVAFAALGRTATRVSRRAADIEVAEKSETKPVSYLESIPRTIIDKPTIDRLLAATPKEQWDNPPEDSPLYVVKLLSETYGPGKATKMRFSDYFYLKNFVVPQNPDEVDNFYHSPEEAAEIEQTFNRMMQGKAPLLIPVAAPRGVEDSGSWINWRGPEPFAGDQNRSAVTDGLFAKQFLDNLAFYRTGLKPWQRGLEIGMAHGYFLIGPFVSLGPLRNTPEAATVGLLSGVALIIIVSSGGLLFGNTIKPTLLDKPGEKPGTGFNEMINWHMIGGIGGAGFAHLLLTIFGS